MSEAVDLERAAAETLVDACIGVSLQARLHWDRSPWMCHVALVDTPAEDFNEYTPGLFFYVEDSDSFFIMGHGANAEERLGYRWHGSIQVDRELDEQYDVNDINIEILERTWLGDTAEDTARKIALLVSMLDASGMTVRA